MILTTTNNIEGHKIVDYLGIVTSIQVERGYKDMTFSESFSQKSYSVHLKKQILEIKEEAFQQISSSAKKLGANAIVGIKLDFEVATQLKIMISVTRTAVKVI